MFLPTYLGSVSVQPDCLSEHSPTEPGLTAYSKRALDNAAQPPHQSGHGDRPSCEVIALASVTPRTCCNTQPLRAAEPAPPEPTAGTPRGQCPAQSSSHPILGEMELCFTRLTALKAEPSPAQTVSRGVNAGVPGISPAAAPSPQLPHGMGSAPPSPLPGGGCPGAGGSEGAYCLPRERACPTAHKTAWTTATGRRKARNSSSAFPSRFLGWFCVFSLLLLRHSPLLARRWEAPAQPPPAGVSRRSGQRSRGPAGAPRAGQVPGPARCWRGGSQPSITAPFPPAPPASSSRRRREAACHHHLRGIYYRFVPFVASPDTAEPQPGAGGRCGAGGREQRRDAPPGR